MVLVVDTDVPVAEVTASVPAAAVVEVTTDPVDCKFVAVSLSIISTLSTVAPLIKISSAFALISNNEPRQWGCQLKQ